MKPKTIHNKKGVQTMKLVFETDNGIRLTSDKAFIRVTASIIGFSIAQGIFDEKNRVVLSRAVAEFLAEYRKNPTTLDLTSYSYIEARALKNLLDDGVEFPNRDILEMFSATLHYYLGTFDEEV